MDEKKLKIIESFKESLKKRIVEIWWIICLFFLVSVGIFYYFNSEDLQKNIKFFVIIMAIFLSIFASLTLAFYFTRKKKFYEILNLLEEEELQTVEKLYNIATIYGHKNLGIITKDGITLIKGFFMFFTIPKEQLIWIYQYNTSEFHKNERIPAMAIVTNQQEMYTLLGYKVTNFMRKIYPNIYLSAEGSLKHRELQNLFAFDFVKMAEATGNFNRLPSTYDAEESKKQTEIAALIDKKKKSREMRTRLKLVFIICFQVGLFLSCIAFALWLLSKNPTTGRKVLIVNITISGIFILFITVITVNFFVKLIKRKFFANVLYFIIIIVLMYGVKDSDLFKFIKDLSETTDKKYFSLGYVKYRDNFWIPKGSEYLLYVTPVNSKNKNEGVLYTVKKSELNNTEDIEEIIRDGNSGKFIYLVIDFYPNTKYIQKVEVLSKDQYEDLVKGITKDDDGDTDSGDATDTKETNGEETDEENTEIDSDEEDIT
ncbi:MAG: hypothetical protein LBT51_02845 [Fusobacteriaceae bacterium]|jgi:hypothetical protein|nr:hypothetical protein [Fusobacteriaceae bacterium]